MNDQDVLDSQQGVRLEDVTERFQLLPQHANQLSSFVGDNDAAMKTIRQGMSMASNAAGDLEELGHSDRQDELQSVLKKCIDLENLVAQQKDTFLKLHTDVIQQRDIGIGLDKYEEYMAEAKQRYQNLTDAEKYHNHMKHKEFKEMIWSVNHPDMDYNDVNQASGNDEDDDVVVAATKKSLKCPITTTWLEEPQTSKSCKHTFSKNAIFGMIRRSHVKLVECPVPGCRQKLDENSFFEDTLMERKVAKAREAEASDDRSQFHDVE